MIQAFGAALVLLLCLAGGAFAGGPLYTTADGAPVVYPKSAFPIPYTVDRGSLGSYDNAKAAALVDDCFAVWQSVPTAAVRFKNNGFLSADINIDYLESNDLAGWSDFYAYLQNHEGPNPVIFDSDGAIIDAFYGENASDDIIGFSGSDTDKTGSYYANGISVLNGRFTEGDYSWEPAQFKATFVHEFGHFIGLDHTQVSGRDFVHDDDTENDIYIPTMYPTSTDDDTPLGDLNPDDEAAVTMLYPADDATVNAAYGRIHGTLRWLIGFPALGQNVVAIKRGDELMSRFSCISDYAAGGDGSFDMLVTPGTYDFMVEPVYPFFYGGSGIGPYSLFPFSRSFIFPAVKADYDQGLTVAAGETKQVALTARRNLFQPFPGMRAWLIELLFNLGLYNP